MKRKVTLYMKNGKIHSLICKNDDVYYELVENIDNDERIDIVFDNKTISIKGSNVDYHESETINNTKDEITSDGLYKIINGKRYATQKLIDLMKKKR
jgi:hypothetical protein